MQHLRVNPLSKKICQDHRPRTGIVFRTNDWVSHTISPSPATRGYITVGLYPNAQPGEIFIRMAKGGGDHRVKTEATQDQVLISVCVVVLAQCSRQCYSTKRTSESG